jgi:ABC-type uncharacterized transport system substrate-binding protein
MRACSRLPALARAAVLAVAGCGLAAAPVSAHPHVFVTTTATIVFERGAITAIDHVWTFDEFYSAMAVEGLDTNKDGKFSREELHELAKTNIEGLKDFGYFTFAKLKEQALKFGEPKDYWLAHEAGALSLHFRLPLDQPVLAEAKGFNISITDPTFYIGFDLAAKEPVKLAGAPKTCRLDVGVPNQEAADAKRLGEAFFQQLGGANFGFAVAKTISVDCGGT